MGHDEKSFSVFTPTTDLASLKGTAYFELHQGELPRRYACWLEGSLFITDEAFNFFEGCFQKTIANFSYFAFNRAASDEVGKPNEELMSFLKSLEGSKDRELIFSKVQSHFILEMWTAVQTEVLRNAVLLCGNAIQRYVSDTRDKKLALQVLGM